MWSCHSVLARQTSPWPRPLPCCRGCRWSLSNTSCFPRPARSLYSPGSGSLRSLAAGNQRPRLRCGAPTPCLLSTAEHGSDHISGDTGIIIRLPDRIRELMRNLELISINYCNNLPLVFLYFYIFINLSILCTIL